MNKALLYSPVSVETIFGSKNPEQIHEKKESKSSCNAHPSQSSLPLLRRLHVQNDLVWPWGPWHCIPRYWKIRGAFKSWEFKKLKCCDSCMSWLHFSPMHKKSSLQGFLLHFEEVGDPFTSSLHFS